MSEEQVAERLRNLELDNAVLHEQVKNMETKINSLSSGVSRGLWVLGGGFIASFVAWVVNGGLVR
jgi:hypothetical protein